MEQIEIWQKIEIINWTQIILNSYQKLLGKDLINREITVEKQAEILFFSPFAVFSHGNQPDPIYNYGNKIGLELWERNWNELVTMPSRLSASPVNRLQRQQSLDQASQQGYIDNYQGIRVSKTGKKYQVKNLTLWNLTDQNNQYCGQAATFSQWDLLSP
jgi:hypothetical protein